MFTTATRTPNTDTVVDTNMNTVGSDGGSNDSDVDVEEEEDQEAWDIMDALYSNAQSSTEDSSISLRSALSADFDALSFGRASRSSLALNDNVNVDLNDENQEIEIPHFPPLSQALLDQVQDQSQSQQNIRTSEPIRPQRSTSQEQLLLSHVTRENFQQLVESPMGLVRFRQWIEEEGYAGSKACLQYYDDAKAYESFLNEMSAATKAMQTVYFEPMSPLSRTLSSRPTDCLPAIDSASLAISSAQTEALDRLYAAEFKRFIAGKITEHARARLGQYASQYERGDLGEVFCIANPNLPDQPLVMVSDGFCKLSEYPRESLVGRNCRFLQGPATDPEAVRLLREAIALGKEHCSLLLNYTRTGRPFWNLFNLIPLRNASGHIDLFLGAQVDVSRAMTSRETFDALTGLGQAADRRAMATNGGSPKENFTFSDNVLQKMDAELNHSTVLRQTPTIPSSAVLRAPSTAQFSPTFTPTSSSPTLTFDNASSGASAGAKRRGSAAAGKMFRLLSKASNSDSFQSAIPLQSISGPPQPISIVQQVPDSVREHMVAFSSAYSKLLVVDPKDGRVNYVTPPLLAELGYSVRTKKDRLSSSLLRKQLVELIIGESSAETESTRRTINQVLKDKAHHSLFASLACAKRDKALFEEAYGGMKDGKSPTNSSNGKKEKEKEKKFVRSLLHLTPVKGGKDGSLLYVVVVG